METPQTSTTSTTSTDKKLTITLTVDQHTRLKVMAAEKGMSIKQVVLSSLGLL